jgi:CTP:molybdopterin cytidylyltransferase MocA
MTTPDIYAWVQMGLQLVIGGGIVVGVSRYFGILRRAIDSQKATIEAQAEHMKAQSAILQDFERLNSILKHVLETVSDPAALQREEAYRARVDRDANAQLDKTARGFTALIGSALAYIPDDVRMNLIHAADLPSASKETLKNLAEAASYARLPSGISVSRVTIVDGARVVISDPFFPPKESQEGT